MSRVVMFVFNDCTMDTRVLREAATLQAAGHRVTIMARPRDVRSGEGERETLDNGVQIIRVPLPQGWRRWWGLIRYPWRARGWVRFRFLYDLRRGPTGWPEAVLIAIALVAGVPWTLFRYVVHRSVGAFRRPQPGGDLADWWVRWRWSIRGWAEAAARAAPPGDVYHGHDLTGLPGAIAARAGKGGVVVYDSHEVFLESGSNARRPRWSRALLAREEGRWTREAAAMVTVNCGLEQELGRRYRPGRTVVVYNCPPRWTPPEPRPDHLRRAAGIPPESPVVLYHGGFSADRGLLPLADALREPGLERAHLVFLGFGDLRARLEHEAADPRYAGRLHVLPGVPPDVLNEWVASADVGAMPNQPATLNERLSTPNKLFESIAAGIPVVLSDFPERRRIVMENPDGPLGAVCDPTKPSDIARAIRSLIDLPPAESAALRLRCLKAAHERWNWETEGAKLVALYGDLVGRSALSPAEPAEGGGRS